jgi:hypothetical protein
VSHRDFKYRINLFDLLVLFRYSKINTLSGIIMKYELHDSQIIDILIGKNKIVLSFSEGFWELDTNGKESSQKQNSKIIFNIDNEFSVPIEDFISIRISKRKNVFKPLSLRDFKKLIKKSPFDVDMEYNCVFSSRKFLQLYSNKIRALVEIFIEDIKSVEYIHD